MVAPREHLKHRARGAAAALILAGAIYGAGIVVHSRTFSEAFDFIFAPLVGIAIAVGLFVSWRYFWLIAFIYVLFGTLVHVLALLPVASPFEGVFSIAAPRLVIDLLILALFVVQRVGTASRQPSNRALEATATR